MQNLVGMSWHEPGELADWKHRGRKRVFGCPLRSAFVLERQRFFLVILVAVGDPVAEH